MSAGRAVVRIACAFDDAYAPHFATLAASLAESRGPERIDVTLLAGPALTDIAIAELQRFAAGLDIGLRPIRMPAAALAKLPPSGSYSSVIWYRIFLPQLLPDCERVLYLDADTLALQSLAPLFGQDLGACVLGAVASPIGPEVVAHCRRIGMDPAEGYFNSGVLLMDLQGMRETGFTEAVLSAVAEAAPLTFPDQDALNLACQNRWLRLHPKWNALSHLWLPHQSGDVTDGSDLPSSDLEREMARRSPAIVHFEGPRTVKPWYFRSLHPLRGIYLEFRQRTPWPLTQLLGYTPAARMLRRLPLKWQYAISRRKTAAVRLLRR